LFSGLIIAVAVLSLGVLAYPSMPIRVGEATTESVPASTVGTLTRPTTLTVQTLSTVPTNTPATLFKVVVEYIIGQITTSTTTTYAVPTTVTVSVTVTSSVTSSSSYFTTYTSSYLTPSTSSTYYSVTVAPYAYYGLSGELFAGVALVVLVLCGAIGFYAFGTGKKHGQVKLTQFVSKKPTCISLS
jgi:hypothetical protein